MSAVCASPADYLALRAANDNHIASRQAHNRNSPSLRRVTIGNATADSRTDYVSGPNGALARIKKTAGLDTVTFIHADHLGTARAGTALGGALVFEDFHTPFGESLIHPDATDNQGDYTGHIRDKATGLSYMQARYQDPLIGRFLSIDPVTFMDTGNPAMFNRYAYVENDPVNMIDRFGLCGTRAESYQDCTIEVDPGQDSSGNDNTLTDDQQSGVDNLTKAIRATGQAIADNGTDEEVAAWEGISKFGINPNEDKGTTGATAYGVNTPERGVQIHKAGVDSASQSQNDANHTIIHETGHFTKNDIDRRQGIQNRCLSSGCGRQFYMQESRNDRWAVNAGKRLGTLPKNFRSRAYPIGGYDGP